MVKIALTQNQTALIDDKDYEMISRFKWQALWRPNRRLFVAGSCNWDPGQKRAITTLMHRLILDAPKGLFVDHVDGNCLNNQRSNLRLCTNRQNSQNRWRLHSNNTSGYKGVSQRKDSGKFFAYITFDSLKIHLGCFATAEEAARAYDKVASKLFGEFASLNF
jgi:HNH endonuclease